MKKLELKKNQKKSIKHLKISTMAKSFKEYIGTTGLRIGKTDRPPKNNGRTADARAVGLNANYSSQAPGTMRPFLTADAKKLQQKNWSSKGFGPKKEDTNRIPRKPGQKAGSDKHSDLYTDENPKGTIHGLGFT